MLVCNAATLDAFLDSFTSESLPANKRLPSVALCVRDSNGEILYQGSRGATLNCDTPTYLASLSKMISPYLIAMAVEDATLDLGENLQARLPNIDLSHVIVMKEDGEASLEAANAPVTIRNACNHTSGLAYISPQLLSYHQKDFRQMLQDFFEVEKPLIGPLTAHPDTKWQYSPGLDVVGLAIESATGSSLENMLQTRICTPLGLSRTSFQPPPEVPAHLNRRMGADPGSFNLTESERDQEWVPGNYPFPLDSKWNMLGGGLFSTANEAAQILACSLNDGQPLLKRPESIELLYADSLPDIARSGLLAELSDQEAYSADTKPGFGFGCYVNSIKLDSIGREKGTASWSGATGSYGLVDRTTGFVCVLILQIFPLEPIVESIHVELQKAVYESLRKA